MGKDISDQTVIDIASGTKNAASMQGYKNLASFDAPNRMLNVVGRTPPIPKQERNKPCGCGSGIKAKKCCGEYAKRGTEQ